MPTCNAIQQEDIELLEELVERVGLSAVVWELGTIAEVRGSVIKGLGLFLTLAQAWTQAGVVLHTAAERASVRKVSP